MPNEGSGRGKELTRIHQGALLQSAHQVAGEGEVQPLRHADEPGCEGALSVGDGPGEPGTENWAALGGDAAQEAVLRGAFHHGDAGGRGSRLQGR